MLTGKKTTFESGRRPFSSTDWQKQPTCLTAAVSLAAVIAEVMDQHCRFIVSLVGRHRLSNVEDESGLKLSIEKTGRTGRSNKSLEQRYAVLTLLLVRQPYIFLEQGWLFFLRLSYSALFKCTLSGTKNSE